MSPEVMLTVNTNPMAFEELATSLATLASYARGDLNKPVEDLDHLYERALQEPPGYAEITGITGHSLHTIDRQRGRAAWLLMNTEDLQVYGVHCRVWHRVGDNYYAPLLSQISRALQKDSQLSHEDIQREGVDLALIDVVGIKDDTIWLVQVLSSDRIGDSALDRVGRNNDRLFRSTVYDSPVLEGKPLESLRIAEKQMSTAFPDVEVFTMVLVLHPSGPDFELYQADPGSRRTRLVLSEDKIRKNSIDYADILKHNQQALFALPRVIDNNLFRGIPPCRGGRTLGMLASAVTRQLRADELLLWERKDFIQMLSEDFEYEIEKDKVRHDLDDRLVAQGFFRKWGSQYFVSMKGVARFQYCLAKFTSVGNESFDLQMCISQRDKIRARFGCVC